MVSKSRNIGEDYWQSSVFRYLKASCYSGLHIKGTFFLKRLANDFTSPEKLGIKWQ